MTRKEFSLIQIASFESKEEGAYRSYVSITSDANVAHHEKREKVEEAKAMSFLVVAKRYLT